MKKTYKNLLVAATLAMGVKVAAQPIPLYQFSQSNGVYTAITGGTVFANAAWDDQIVVDMASSGGVTNGVTGSGLPIGFNLNFGGLTYDCFGFSNNGYMFLGQTALGAAAINNNQTTSSYWLRSLEYTGSTAPTALQNRIGAVCCDLYGQTGSDIRYQILGTAPTQTCVLQFTNMRRDGAGGLSFQIRLTQGANSIEIVYGTMTFVSTDVLQIGLRGSAAATDFNMRTRSGGAWNLSSAATNVTQTNDYSPTLFPASGLTYRWDPPVPCSSVPFTNSVVASSTMICANIGRATLNLSTSYTLSGLTYSWQSSANQVGPFTNVAGANTPILVTPTVGTNTYYQMVVNCANAVGNMTTAPVRIQVANVTTTTVPYFENFEGISTNPSMLPNCSWSGSNLNNTTLTYTNSNTLGRTPRQGSGTSFASFYNSPAGTNYFYTNGIYLNTGITYSANLWYQTEYFGYNNWTDLSILYGTTQSPTGLTTIVSSNGPVVSNVYKSLGGTFTVATSGLYYVAVRGVGAAGSAPYLSWDDLSITIPCNATSPNTPTLSLQTNTTSICSGEPVSLTIAGADTYTWNTGDNTSAITQNPTTDATYSVVGVNAVTGCSSTAMQHIVVMQTPAVIIAASAGSVCPGSSANLQALSNGNVTYAWSNNQSVSSINVSPTAPTNYIVMVTGVNGCVGSASVSVGLYGTPNVIASTNRPNEMCKNEVAELTAVGTGVSYQWISSTASTLLSGNPVSVSPNITSIYTVTATDAHGCKKTATIVQNVSECTGIVERNASSTLNVYPNPTSGEFSIASNNALAKTIEVVDVTGKVVYTSNSSMEVVSLNIKNLSNGVYYVKVQSNNTVEVLKIVKQ